MQTSLLFGIHCHQPVDNFDWVVYKAIENSYKPFFQTIQKFPDFKISVHFSGWLLEFIEKNDSELFALMQSLSKQIEFFTGGYYEPVLASIPPCDREAQIKKLSGYIKKHFKQTPKGLWLTERVWDDSIIRDVKACGIEYVIVDDYHLHSSGIQTDKTNGYFITEDGGEALAIFPINKKLRYAIPFYSLSSTNELLHSFSEEDGRNAAIIFDDGEKFGIWPDTHERVYEKKWLEDFILQTLEDESIRVETFKEYYTRNRPISLVYLQNVSYAEMSEWSLECDASLQVDALMQEHKELSHFIRGGTWKNFFNKYQEANWIQKRFLELSKKQTNDKKYLDALYRAQCNDTLWHGVFGGVYLPNLRDNAYRYIIECETMHTYTKESFDIDMDGFEEYKYKSANLLTVLSSKNGGQIMELDLLKERFNLQNTLSRYEEAYHKKIVVKSAEELEEQSEQDTIATIHDNELVVSEDVKIIKDWYVKRSAMDHIAPKFSLENFYENSFREVGDFANQPFEVLQNTKERFVCKREGGIYFEKKYPTSLKKKFAFLLEGMDISVRLESEYEEALEYLHEWNLHFANYEELLFNDEPLTTDSLSLHAMKLTIKDPYTKKKLTFAFKESVNIYVTALNTVSQSESGVDLTLQGVSLGFVYSFAKSLNVEIQFKISDLEV